MPRIVTDGAVKARRFWWAPLASIIFVLAAVVAIDLARGATPGSAGEADKDLFADVNCSQAVDTVDPLFTLRNVAALPITQQEPCPDIGTTVLLNGVQYTFGDTDCDGDVDSVDALIILRWIAGLLGSPVPRARVGGEGPTCPLPGDPVDIEENTGPTPTDTPAPLADLKIIDIDVELFPLRSAAGVGSQFFLDDRVPAEIEVEFHNNGPDVLDAFIELDTDVEDGEFDFDFVPGPDDICLDSDGEEIDCDDDHVEGLVVFLDDLEVSVTQFITRDVDIICRETGDYDFDFDAHIGPDATDPNTDNNDDTYIVSPPDFPICVP